MPIINQINLKRIHMKNNNLDITVETIEVTLIEEEETTKKTTLILLEELKLAMNRWSKMEVLVWKEINSQIETEVELLDEKVDIDLVAVKEREETEATNVEQMNNFTTGHQDQRVQAEAEVQHMKTEISIEDE